MRVIQLNCSDAWRNTYSGRACTTVSVERQDALHVDAPRHKLGQNHKEEVCKQSETRGRSSRFFLSEICMVIVRQGFCRNLIWENSIGARLGKSSQLECLFVHREIRLFFSVYVDVIKSAGKKQNTGPMWKSTRQRSRFGRTNIILWSCLLGCPTRQCETCKKIVDNYKPCLNPGYLKTALIALAYFSYSQCLTPENDGNTEGMCLLNTHGLGKKMIVTVLTYHIYIQNQTTEDKGPITRYYVLRNLDPKTVVLINGLEKKMVTKQNDVTQAGSVFFLKTWVTHTRIREFSFEEIIFWKRVTRIWAVRFIQEFRNSNPPFFWLCEWPPVG